MSAFRLCVAMCTYKRPELTKAVMKWWDGLSVKGVDLRFVAYGDYRGDHPASWDVVWSLNERLGLKHNLMMQQCAEHDPDAVMVIGSDDICEPELIGATVEGIRGGACYTQPTEMYAYDPPSGFVARLNAYFGAGRTWPRSVLDQMEWEPWNPWQSRGLDGNSDYRVKQAMSDGVVTGVGPWVTVSGAVLDIKSTVNMRTFDELVHKMTPVPTSCLSRFEIDRLDYEPEPIQLKPWQKQRPTPMGFPE